ncbi:hypothetical protein F2P81_003414 [Scophthalmus maximus]|uniref:Uncharacterized protein n=1 Tax=Scophthalmus maximus TaxID=52904 RepID=A0A6A4T9K5_SCOMX|nr:hypothetical protein F2P81_003414 [Scophthalmus maximus]
MWLKAALLPERHTDRLRVLRPFTDLYFALPRSHTSPGVNTKSTKKNTRVRFDLCLESVLRSLKLFRWLSCSHDFYQLLKKKKKKKWQIYKNREEEEGASERACLCPVIRRVYTEFINLSRPN